MRVCYCEDEKSQALLFKKKIEQWAEKNKSSVSVDLFESAEEFLFKTGGTAYDVIFLDISMKGQNGMELARKIREKEKQVLLVFVTSDAGYVFDGYEVNAYRYLMKPVAEEKLWEILNYASEQNAEKEDDCILVKKDSQLIKISLNQLLYLEAQGHYVNLYLENSETVTLKTGFLELLEEIQKKSSLFCMVHRSYAVNISKVARIGRTECVLTDKSVVVVSRSFYKKVNEAFIKYHLERNETNFGKIRQSGAGI